MSDICTICSEPNINPDVEETQSSQTEPTGTLKIECGHTFHEPCTVKHFKENITCPTCKKVSDIARNIYKESLIKDKVNVAVFNKVEGDTYDRIKSLKDLEKQVEAVNQEMIWLRSVLDQVSEGVDIHKCNLTTKDKINFLNVKIAALNSMWTYLKSQQITQTFSNTLATRVGVLTFCSIVGANLFNRIINMVYPPR